MSLRYVVPTLGAIALTAGTASAADELVISGFVDTIYTYTSVGDTTSTSDDGHSDSRFTAAAELQASYNVGEAVTAQLDLAMNNNNNDEFDLEQAYINWTLGQAGDGVFSLTTGKFTNHLGWEDVDAPGLYRINNSTPFVALTGYSAVGAAINYEVEDMWSASFFLTNGFGLQIDESNNDAKSDDGDLSWAVDFTYNLSQEGIVDAALNADFTVDTNDQGVSINNTTYNDVTTWQFGLNGEFTNIADYEPLMVAVDWYMGEAETTVGTTDRDWSRGGLVITANHEVPDDALGFPNSITAQWSYLGGGQFADQTEIALAWLTNPTGNGNFGVNAEIAMTDYVSDEAEYSNGTFGTKDSGNFWVGFEVLAVLP